VVPNIGDRRLPLPDQATGFEPGARDIAELEGGGSNDRVLEGSFPIIALLVREHQRDSLHTRRSPEQAGSSIIYE
jgi:hypothetical protein